MTSSSVHSDPFWSNVTLRFRLDRFLGEAETLSYANENNSCPRFDNSEMSLQQKLSYEDKILFREAQAYLDSFDSVESRKAYLENMNSLGTKTQVVHRPVSPCSLLDTSLFPMTPYTTPTTPFTLPTIYTTSGQEEEDENDPTMMSGYVDITDEEIDDFFGKDSPKKGENEEEMQTDGQEEYFVHKFGSLDAYRQLLQEDQIAIDQKHQDELMFKLDDINTITVPHTLP